MKIRKLSGRITYIGILTLLASSCSALIPEKLVYTSLRPVDYRGNYKENESKAKEIVVLYSFNSNGSLLISIFNPSSENQLYIDKSASYFLDSGSKRVNLKDSEDFSPIQYIDPKSHVLLPVEIRPKGLKRETLISAQEGKMTFTPENSPYKYSCQIAYSPDGGITKKTLKTEFYTNSLMVYPIPSSRQCNETLRSLLNDKKDALSEPHYVLTAIDNKSINNFFHYDENSNVYQKTNHIYDWR